MTGSVIGYAALREVLIKIQRTFEISLDEAVLLVSSLADHSEKKKALYARLSASTSSTVCSGRRYSWNRLRGPDLEI